MKHAAGITRRRFVANVGTLASAAPLMACASATAAGASAPLLVSKTTGTYDLSWIQRVSAFSDRAVFDWPSLGSAEDSIVLQIAGRYLDNCAVAYPAGSYKAVAVMNIRTAAIYAALNDDAWSRFALGAEAKVTDPATQKDSVRNPFWSRPAGATPTPGMPTLKELVQRDAIILVCDFAMGHLATRVATKMNQPADDVHQAMLHSLVPNAYAVPSGIFGLARSQNAGCAFVRM